MEDSTAVLLPLILETLSRKPELSDTYDNLCNEIEDVLAPKNRNGEYGTIRQDIRKSLNVGKSLGIISLTNHAIRLNMSFRTNDKYSRAAAPMANHPYVDENLSMADYRHRHSPQREHFQHCPPKDSEITHPRHRRPVNPNLLPHVHAKRKSSRSPAARRHTRVGRRSSSRSRSRSKRR